MGFYHETTINGEDKEMVKYSHILEMLVQLLVLLGGGLGYLRLRAPDLLEQLPVTLELWRRPRYHLTEHKAINQLN